MFQRQLLVCANLTALFTSVFLLSACGEKKAEVSTPKEKKLTPVEKRRIHVAEKIEKFTGTHTRIVWTEISLAGEADAMAVSEKNILRGIDTRDGHGERRIIKETGNYSRPLLSTDGSVIIYTEKNISRKKGLKSYRPVIFRTDWTSGKSTKLTDGYAVDTWTDPATQIEWVYAVRNIKTAKAIALEASELVRFQLNDPGKVELVYNETPVGPDNIQLSRDGTRASGLFPWPHCGVFHIEDGKWSAVKKSIGCWPSMAPDNSGVSWVFEGQHRKAFFFADDDRPGWTVPLDNAPVVGGHEVYHPRWSNHARFISISGPYIKTTNAEGSVINKGGAYAQILIGKLNENATEVEDWLQLSGDDHGESYPDVWIADGDQSSLKGYGIGKSSGKLASSWPITKEGVLFLWQNREALNSYTTRDGAKHEARVDSHGAARFGRYSELLLDGGWYELEPDSGAPALAHLKANKDFTIDTIVLPEPASDTGSGNLFRGPGLTLSSEGHLLMVNGQKSSTPAPEQPYHLSITKTAGKLALYVNGSPVPLENSAPVPPPDTENIIFGGDWDGGLLHIGFYDHALSPDQIRQSSELASAFLQKLPAPPAQVKLQAKLIESSAMPTAEGIDPYTSSLVVYHYEVEKVLQGDFKETEVLVKHWGMLGRQTVQDMPRELGKSYELTLEREADHAYLKGERVMDDTTAFDLVPWFDVAPPRVKP